MADQYHVRVSLDDVYFFRFDRDNRRYVPVQGGSAILMNMYRMRDPLRDQRLVLQDSANPDAYPLNIRIGPRDRATPGLDVTICYPRRDELGFHFTIKVQYKLEGAEHTTRLALMVRGGESELPTKLEQFREAMINSETQIRMVVE